MPNYRLTYFDMDGGRAEPIRIAFHAAGIDFEDIRITFPEFVEARASYRFNCVPVLEIDGVAKTRLNRRQRRRRFIRNSLRSVALPARGQYGGHS